MKSGKAGDGGGTIRELRIARAGKKSAPKRSKGNPLRSGLRIERVPDPNTVVLFGATGDLGILNRAGATAAEIRELHDLCIREVQAQAGITLTSEIQFIGEEPA